VPATITIGSSNASFAAGTFAGGVGAITVNGNLTISGTAFTSTSGVLSLAGDFTFSGGSFTHNSGTLKVTTSSTLTGSPTLYKLEWAPAAAAATYTVASGSTLTVANTLTYSGSYDITVNTGTIAAQGDIVLNNSATGGGGTAALLINGGGAQTLTGNATINTSRLCNVQINKTTGTLTLSSTISIAGSFTHTASDGGLTVTGSKMAFCPGATQSITLTKPVTLNNVTFTNSAGSVVTISGARDTITVNDSLVIAGTGSLRFNTGNIHAQGNVIVSNTTAGTVSGTLTKININGSASQVLSGQGTSTGPIFDLIFSKTGGTMTISSITDVYGTLTIAGGTASQALSGTGTLNARGNVTVTNTATAGGGTATIAINGTGAQTLTGSGQYAKGILPKITVNKTTGILTLSSIISVAGDFTHTASSGGLTVTGSKVVFCPGATQGIVLTKPITLNKVAFDNGSTGSVVTISGARDTLTVGDSLVLAGTASLCFNTGNIHAKGHVNITNTTTPSLSGTLTKLNINGSGSQTLTGHTTATGPVFDLIFSKSAGTMTISNVTDVYGTLTIAGAATSQTLSGTGTLNARGNVTVSNTATTGGGGTATINFTGGNSQTFTGASDIDKGRLPNITINKSGGTLTLSSIISVLGNWTHTTGTVAYGTSTVAFIGNSQICTVSGAGALGFNNVVLHGASALTFKVDNITMTVNGTLTVSGTAAVNINSGTTSGTVLALGNVTVTNTSTSGNALTTDGTALIKFSGTAVQTLTGLSDPVNDMLKGKLPNVEIAKTGGSLALSGVISTGKNWTHTSGIVSAGTSKMVFCGLGFTANTLDISSASGLSGALEFNDVSFHANGFLTLRVDNSTMKVKGNLTMEGGTGTLTLNAGSTSGVIEVEKDVTITNTGFGNGGSGGTALMKFTNSFNQTLTGSGTINGGKVPNVEINKSGGTLTLSGTISTARDWTHTAGTVVAATGSTLAATSAGSTTITGCSSCTTEFENITLHTLSSIGNTILTVVNNVTAKGDLTFSGAGNVYIISGTLNVQKNVNLSCTGTIGGGGGTINFTGGNTQTLYGSGILGAGRSSNIAINKTTGTTLTLSGIISCGGDWTYNTGNVVASGGGVTSTVAMCAGGTLDAQGTSGDMTFSNLTINGGTVTLGGILNTSGNITISSGATLSGATYTLNSGGNWTNNGSFTAGTSTVVFNAPGDIHAVGRPGAVESFYNLKLDKNAGHIQLSSAVIVSNELILTKGQIETTSSNLLTLNDNVTVTGGSDLSYVHGPMKKVGNDAFTFPLGDMTLGSSAYHPFGISAPGATGDAFIAQYHVGQPPNYGLTLINLDCISAIEYWTIDRALGSSEPIGTLHWNTNSSIDVVDESDLTIAEWDGSAWQDLERSDLVISNATGHLSTLYPIKFPTTPKIITWGCPKAVYGALTKDPDGTFYRTYKKKLYFKYDEKYNDGTLKYTIYNSSHQPMQTSSLVLNKNYGSNWFDINLTSVSGFVLNSVYLLEVENDKGQKEYLRFKYMN
jgi:hypothetical protein